VANKEEVKDIIDLKIQTVVAKECEKLVNAESSEGLLGRLEKVILKHVRLGSGNMKNMELRDLLVETFEQVIENTVPADKGHKLVLKRLIYKLHKI